MQIIEFKESEKNKYNNFSKNELLQKWQWGSFKKQSGWKIKRLGVLDSSKIIFTIQLLIKKLPFGMSFIYSPHVIFPQEKVFELILKQIKEVGRKEGSLFLMIEGNKKESLKKLGFKKSFEDIQPKITLTLDLTKSDDEILSQMKPKGRYNIRIAAKKGVTIKEIKLEHEFNDYREIHAETAKRDRISARSFPYLKRLFIMLTKEGLGTCLIAYYQKKPIAGGIFSFVDDKATYLYGASSNNNRNVMAPYLLQWEAIQMAKKRGCKLYDFYGIAPQDSNKHQWNGITNFKRKFGGKEIKSSGGYNLIYRPLLYVLFILAEKIRKVFV